MEDNVTTPAETVLEPTADDKGGRLPLTAVAIIVVGIFATTFPQTQTLGRLPLSLMLKNEVHLSRTEIASFFFFIGLAWYLKPLAGIFTDAFPLFKTRRRHYILISSVLACASWLVLGMLPHTFGALMAGAMVLNLFMVMTSTVVGAYLVEAGRQFSATGRLTAVRIFVQNLSTLLVGPIGGFLAGGAFMVAAGVNAFFVLSIFPVVYILLREQPTKSTNRESLIRAKDQFGTIVRSRTLWFALVFLGLFYFAPGFSTPLLFRQQDELKFAPQFIGNLGIFAGGAGILAAVVYGFVVKKLPLRALLVVGPFCATLGTLSFLAYSSSTAAMGIEAFNGFMFTLAELALIDLAARATPAGCEGLGYSLILSIRNVALFGADIVGSKLADSGWGFNSLVYLNAGTTAIVLALLPLLPRSMMVSKDAQPTSA